MEAEFELDLTDFRAAVKLYMKTTKRDLSVILNEWGKDICFRAMRHTARAKAKDINPMNPAGKVKRNRESRRIMHALATKAGRPKGTGNTYKATQIFNARKRSIGFLRAMYLQIIRDLGGKLRTRPFGGGAAADSRAIKATPSRLLVDILTGDADNEAIAIMLPAFQKALNEKAADRIAYANKKLSRTADRFSAR